MISGKYCEGCSVKNTEKPFYCRLPSKLKSNNIDILFVTDSYKLDGSIVDSASYDLITRTINKIKGKLSYTIVSAIQCPNVKDEDMNPEDRNRCRNYIFDIILSTNPKLIISLGNLSFKIITKKSGISDKRGYKFTINIGDKTFIIIPTYHPFIVAIEPKYRYFFEMDIRNSIDKYIFKKTNYRKLEHSLILDVKDLEDNYSWLKTTDKNIAVDLETTGLNFLTDVIMTIGISWNEKTIVIPWKHRESGLDYSDREYIREFLKPVFFNNNNKKIFHNAKFDIKFLKKEGLEIVNPWDTMVMAHLIFEDRPKRLLDLVKEHFPRELEES